MDNKNVSLTERLSEILIDKKLVSKEDIKNAVELQKKKGGKLSDILLGQGLITRENFIEVLCEEFGYPAIDLSRYKITDSVLKLVSKKIAKQYNLIPVSRMGNVLTVAMSDPLDVLALDDIRNITGCDIGAVIAAEQSIRNAIAEYYDGLNHATIEKMVEGITEEDSIKIVDEKPEDETGKDDIIKLIEDAPVVRVTNLLLADAIKMKASDVLIEPLEDELRIRYRVDGILLEGRRPPKKIHSAIISRLKVMSDLNIAETRLPQDGRFKLKTHNGEVDFRISVLPSSMGEKVALRVLDKSQATLDLDKLGFEQKPLDDIKKEAKKPHGMILICGPTGCGKTTTLYSILKLIDSPEKNLVTVEDPVEYQLYGINQVSVRPAIGLTFPGSLRSILRQDPDIVMIGEIRDFDTVDIAVKAALTGHLVLSTLHTTTASGAIVRLVNMGVEPFLITSSVLLVAAQRLLRKICPSCKQAYKLDQHVSEKLSLKNKAEVFKGKGCKKCMNTGYRGRVGLLETIKLTPNIRELILNRSQEHILREEAAKEGMQSLRENAVTKMLNGITTVEEVLRATIGEQNT